MAKRPSAVMAAAALTLALSPPASADGGDEARVKGNCGRGATSELRLRARDGEIRVEFTLRPRRPAGTWRTSLVHERRVEWRGNLRGEARLRREVANLAGPDQVTVRASGPGGVTCAASATLTA